MLDYPNNYENITILCYPNNAGGNFLINCLSLSDQCVFRDAQLVNKQLQGKFNYYDKIQYLHDQLNISQQNNKWNDLSLGCSNLFGVNNNLYLVEYHELLLFQFDSVINKIIDKKLNMFLVANSTIYLEAILKFWPNAKVIVFTDYRNFINKRINHHKKVSTQLLSYWNKIKDPTWPSVPPSSQDEFIQLPDNIKHELKNEFNYEISRWFDQQPLWDKLFIDSVGIIQQRYTNQQLLMWNVENNYKSSQNFINQFNACRSWLNLPETDESDLITYFERWHQIIHQINQPV